MIIAAVDDLLFSSKIRTVAKQLGATVVFARTPDAILQNVREHPSALLVIDLNGERMAPIQTLGAIRADPSLQSIRTVAFVSHVQTDLIEAAREAGAGTVMARSAFVASLPDILRDAL